MSSLYSNVFISYDGINSTSVGATYHEGDTAPQNVKYISNGEAYNFKALKLTSQQTGG